ncbi:MAG: GFA family protein [Gammaproteobacteria bacterium]|nr:GFA family protein [Gammaproteobacteria bacterium]
MAINGGCYCGAVRYEISGEATFSGQCHCRECQYITGGHPNVVMGVPEADFEYTAGTPQSFAREDLDAPVSREFCGKCGTHILGRTPGMGLAIIKAGTLDDPSQFPGLQMAIFTCDAQPYHHIPDGVAAFERTPG